MREARFFGLSVLFLLVSFVSAYAQDPIIINVPDDHGTIQEAVDAVVADDTTIEVDYNYGTPYVENVVVNTPSDRLTIKGVGGGRPVCKGEGRGRPSNSQNAFTIELVASKSLE